MESTKGSERATIVVANLPVQVKEALAVKAKANHRSMAAEARLALTNHVGEAP